MKPDDPVHVLGNKIFALIDELDTETAANALLVCLRVLIINMRDDQADAVTEAIPRWLAEALHRRQRWKKERGDRATQ